MRKAKTDQKDALLLADLLRLGRAPATRLPSETILKLQTLSRLRFEFVRQVGGLKNKVLGILDRIFPEYPGCFSDVFIRTSRELLKSYPEPEDLAEVDLSELSAFLKEHSRGRLGEERAEKIQSLAKGTFGITLALDAFTLQLRFA
ncbi:MAG: putative transposase [Thermoanaerobacterales bacterium 50_218]|nr:MAG: putative transposase [Thermoanaerobacterales bacterium 50_218]